MLEGLQVPSGSRARGWVEDGLDIRPHNYGDRDRAAITRRPGEAFQGINPTTLLLYRWSGGYYTLSLKVNQMKRLLKDSIPLPYCY